MKGHARIMVFMLLVGLLVLTGCEKKYTGSESTDTKDMTDTDTESQAESLAAVETETESETNPVTVKESVEAEKVTESSIQNKKDFESSLGYHVIFDESLFEYNRTGDYDEIALKGQTFSSKPPVFFAAMKIQNDQIESVVDAIFDASAQNTTIGEDGYPAVCEPTWESLDNDEDILHHNQYLVRLDNGDALLFEIQWYEEPDSETSYGRELQEMLDSIVIEGCTPKEIPPESLAETQESETESQSESETEDE